MELTSPANGRIMRRLEQPESKAARFAGFAWSDDILLRDVLSTKLSPRDDLFSRIVLARKALGLNQVVFAEKIEISQGHISGIEKGIKVPSAQLLLAIEHVWSISKRWLETGEGEMFVERSPLSGADETELEILKQYRKADERNRKIVRLALGVDE